MVYKKLLISFSQELLLFFDKIFPGDTFLRENILGIVFSVFWRPKSARERTVITDEVSYYQDLNMPKEENPYQTLELH